MPDSSPPSRHRLTLSPAALNFDDNTPAAHARRVQVVRPLPPSAPYGALDWSLLVKAGPDAARMAAVGATRRHRLFSWTRVIGVLIVGLLAAYAGHTYRVVRLSYCDNGVAPTNAWWPGAGGAPAMRAVDSGTDSDGRCRWADVVGAGSCRMPAVPGGRNVHGWPGQVRRPHEDCAERPVPRKQGPGPARHQGHRSDQRGSDPRCWCVPKCRARCGCIGQM